MSTLSPPSPAAARRPLEEVSQNRAPEKEEHEEHHHEQHHEQHNEQDQEQDQEPEHDQEGEQEHKDAHEHDHDNEHRPPSTPTRSRSDWGAPPPVPSRPRPSTPRERPTSAPASTQSTPSTMNLATPEPVPPLQGPTYRSLVANLVAEDFANPGPALMSRVRELLELGPDDDEEDFQEQLASILKCAYTFEAPWGSTSLHVQRNMDLNKVKLDGRPGLASVDMHQRISGWLTDASDSASDTGSRRSPAQKAADAARRGVRAPDLAFTVRVRDVNRRVRFSTLGATGEVKSDEAKAKAGLCQGILYCALTYALTGADLGMYAFQTRFTRMVALGPRLVAIERIAGIDDTAGSDEHNGPRVVPATDFVGALHDRTSAQVGAGLPWDLRGADGHDPAALEALGQYATASFDCLLDLHRPDTELGFPRFTAASTLQLSRSIQLSFTEDDELKNLLGAVRPLTTRRKRLRSDDVTSSNGAPPDSDSSMGSDGRARDASGRGMGRVITARRGGNATKAARTEAAPAEDGGINSGSGSAGSQRAVDEDDAGGFADDERGLAATEDDDSDEDADDHPDAADRVSRFSQNVAVEEPYAGQEDDCGGWEVSDTDESLDEETTLALFADCGPRVIQISSDAYNVLLRARREQVPASELVSALRKPTLPTHDASSHSATQVM